jgi:hypothetical protein
VGTEDEEVVDLKITTEADSVLDGVQLTSKKQMKIKNKNPDRLCSL